MKGPDVVHYWDRRKHPPVQPVNHYEDDPKNFNHFGYNFEQMEFPIHKNEEMKKKFEEKDDGKLQLPSEIKPTWDPTILCSHNLNFDPSDDALILVHDTVTVYEENKETEKKVLVYGRKTVGMCPVSFIHLLFHIGLYCIELF